MWEYCVDKAEKKKKRPPGNSTPADEEWLLSADRQLSNSH